MRGHFASRKLAAWQADDCFKIRNMLTLRFDDGTLVLEGVPQLSADHQEQLMEMLSTVCVWDERIKHYRARACDYAAIMRGIHGVVSYDDQAQAYQTLAISETKPMPLRPYQQASLDAWLAAKRRGLVVLPTGAGKTYVALRAILACQRSALVVTPTIDLVHQWVSDLQKRLNCPIGQYGGGEKKLQDITVSTYDSAVLIMQHYGNRFGVLVCDECHHLPSFVNASMAEQCIAPFRLGLTATPEREDGLETRLDDLIGPEVHRSQITELEGEYLANYQAEILEIAMDPEEYVEYEANRRIYLDFVRAQGINFSQPDSWANFMASCARAQGGREVMAAYRKQKRLARASSAKLRVVWSLLRDHAGERCIIFTDDNATAYDIGKQMVLPVLTHHTKSAERKAMLAAFRSGELPVLVTSRVLNEGVDVPEASVGIVVSGTGSVREHVQRLGRILRPSGDKVAVLYEMISAGTGEAYTSERRRSHIAFGEMADFGSENP